ncbi:MAG TPA: phosphatidylglycerol lysyltransferase domain-containing protein [Lachnospiraceae bacterium]|nr:phosphatidylglycerol lysyltransferase domain-containing protein [Lachnospiraceae bacterium]
MITFKKIELEDREWIEARLKESDYRSCDYSFVNNYIWREANHVEYANVDNFYCLKSGKGEHQIYTYPAGIGDIKSVIETLIEDARERDITFRLRGMTKEATELLEELFPGRFSVTLPREECDYLYLTERLTTLAGKKLHGKRNHIARFKDDPNWVYEEITRDNIDECFEMNKRWCKVYECNSSKSLQHEYCAVKRAFDNYFDLGLVGGLLRRDGEVIAYTMGEPLSSDTFVVHIEKSFVDIQGAYPMINQQFVIHNCQDYLYVNREEDLGDEGLRKAKLSYYPDLLLEKYIATLNV